MAHLITAATLLDAWIQGALYVLDNDPALNLTLEVASPGRIGGDHATSRRIDQYLRAEKAVPSHTVADTIFPSVAYRRHGLRGVFEVYPNEIYPLIKRGWGTYAYRMVRREKLDGQVFNPLACIVEEIRRELERRPSMRSRYDLGLLDLNLDLPIYDQSIDGRRRRGSPCLVHLSFKLFPDALHLVAFYRSHDYSYKAFGNLLGLARLQACVATATQQQVGTLAVHSSYAQVLGGKQALQSCIDDIRSALKTNGERDVVDY